MAHADQDPFPSLEPTYFVSPQITAEDVARAKEFGVTLIINNRPDGEEPGQPKGEMIAAAAKANGLAYVEIPIGRTGVTERHLDDFDKAQNGAGKTLAFCRSGMRSTIVWAMAKARAGEDVASLIQSAADAGYDISGQEALLHAAKTGE
ncbi:MAG: TIGR01244 family sulfur transferase [Pseudomonadota bacterium]